MSVQTWREEFFPIGSEKEKDDKKGVILSIKKWEGLRLDNLKKHGCSVFPRFIDDGKEEFDIDGTNCPLCKVANERAEASDAEVSEYELCEFCVLSDVLGRTCLDGSGPIIAPWDSWYAPKNPEPMIEMLQECLDKME